MPPRNAQVDPPPCPVTGEPAARLVQWISSALLIKLWKTTFGVDVRPSFRGVKRFGLWESPTGLYFFYPMLAGDNDFYKSFYKRLSMLHPSETRRRAELDLAGGHVRPDDLVLDIGCGFGAFRYSIPHARYVGIDPNFAGEAGTHWARIETLEAHLESHAGEYDAACAFQVLEHVEKPRDMLQGMVQALKPGGRVMIGVPQVPAAHSRLPNHLLNAVPHHLTWWTREALLTAADRAGLVNATVEVAPWAPIDSIVYWMSRCSPVQCREQHYKHAWSWHASSLFAFAAGYVMWKVRGVPRPGLDEGASLLLVAEKPL